MEGCVMTALCHSVPGRRRHLPAGALKRQHLLMTGSDKAQSWELVCFGEMEDRPSVSWEQPAPWGTGKRRDSHFSAPGNTISKSRIGASHYTKYTSHKSLPLLFSLFFFSLWPLRKMSLSLSFSVPIPELSCFVSCWAFTTRQFPHQSEQHLNKHQQKMSEGACE